MNRSSKSPSPIQSNGKFNFESANEQVNIIYYFKILS